MTNSEVVKIERQDCVASTECPEPEESYRVIPVGQEYSRQKYSAPEPSLNAQKRVHPPPAATHKQRRSKPTSTRVVRDKQANYDGRLKDLNILISETMRALRPAELRVWLAIFNCAFNGRAQIGYSRIQRLTGLSRKSVGEAIKDLESKGLIEVVFRGRFRRSSKTDEAGGGNCGEPSIYRIYPRRQGVKPEAEATPPTS